MGGAVWYYVSTCRSRFGGGFEIGSRTPSSICDRTSLVVLKVIAYDRPGALASLLESLRRARIDRHDVSLEVLVDAPRNIADTELVSKVGQTKAVASDFAWPYGDKKVRTADN